MSGNGDGRHQGGARDSRQNGLPAISSSSSSRSSSYSSSYSASSSSSSYQSELGSNEEASHSSRRKRAREEHNSRGLLEMDDEVLEDVPLLKKPIEEVEEEGLLGAAPVLPPMFFDAVLGDLESDSDEADEAPCYPTADWVCGVCSNINSIQRVRCFRCCLPYGRNEFQCPGPELVVRGVLPRADANDPTAVGKSQAKTTVPSAPAQTAEEGEQMVLAAWSAVYAHHRESLVTDAIASRGRGVYVRFPTTEAATKALVLCRCELTLGDAAARCAVEFSRRHVTRAPGAEVPVDGDVGLLDARAAGSDASAGADPVDPALANVPKELWPAHWTPPPSFASAQEERNYLALLSTHWGILSAKQKAYYDDAVKQALARTETADVPEAAPPAPPADKTPSATTVVSPPSPSSLSDIKKRLADRKAALVNKTTAAAPSSHTATTSPKAGTNSNTLPSTGVSAVSNLKQRLAMKKAQLASASTPVATNESPAAPPSKSPDEASNATVTPSVLRYGFPCPPSHRSEPPSSRRAVLSGIPLDVARRLVSPALLDTGVLM